MTKHTTATAPKPSNALTYVALDVHKQTIAVAVAEVGKTDAQVLGIIPNDERALRALMRKLGPPARLRACYEAGPRGYVIHRFLQRLKIDCVVEDEAFLADMNGMLRPNALAALQNLSDALGLEYGGIDFSVAAAACVLLFEANTTMVLVLPDLDERWADHRAPVERVRDAAREMLIERAKRAACA